MSIEKKKIAIEQAIVKKYGKETVQTPGKDWTPEQDEKLRENLNKREQARYQRQKEGEKVSQNGFLISKRILREEGKLSKCLHCNSLLTSSVHLFYIVKYDACKDCYIKYIEGREERWQSGWRPNED